MDMHNSAIRGIALAAQAAMSIPLSHIGQHYMQMSGEIAEYIRRSIILPSDVLRSQAAQAIGVIAQSVGKINVNFDAIAAAAIQNVNYARIGGNSLATAIAALQSQQAQGLKVFQESFAGIMAGTLKQAFEALDERDERAFEQLEQLIDEKISTLPRNQVTAESLWQFLLMLFITLGLGLYQIKQDNDSGKTQTEQHNQAMIVMERIANNIQRLFQEQDLNVYYVAERKVNLKIKPKNNSLTITTLFPNQKTRLVQINHQWIYIEYFDYLEGVPKYGWASKKYLKRINN